MEYKDVDVYKFHSFEGTYETVEWWLKKCFPGISRKTIKRIIALCHEINFKKDCAGEIEW